MTVLPPHICWGKEKAWKCYIDNWYHDGETIIVEDSELHLIPIKAYFGASSDGKDACTSVNTFLVIVWRSSVHTAFTNVSL